MNVVDDTQIAGVSEPGKPLGLGDETGVIDGAAQPGASDICLAAYSACGRLVDARPETDRRSFEVILTERPTEATSSLLCTLPPVVSTALRNP